MKKLLDAIIQTIIYIIRPFIKQKKNTFVFGSWCGELVIDNSFYLAKYFDQFKHFEMYWVGKKNIKNIVSSEFKNIKFLDMDKFSTLIIIMKSSVVFHSQMLQGDLPRFNIYKKAIKIHLLHGLAIKKVYSDAINIKKTPFIKRVYSSYLGSHIKDDYYLSSSPALSINLKTAFSLENNNQLLEFGSPRNDYIINLDEQEKERIIQKYSKILSCNLAGKKIILYAPTYRRIASNNISLSSESEEKVNKLVNLLKKENAVLIEKKHFVGIKTNMDGTIKRNDNFFCVDSIAEINFQELLAITDVLVSDYSGAIFDFSLTDKPQVSFVFDYENYKNIDSGLYYDVEEYSPGDIVYSYDELINNLDFILKFHRNKRNNNQNVKNKFLACEHGMCSEQLLNFLLSIGCVENKNE